MVGGYIIVQGRADDTMNLGGIKVLLFQENAKCWEKSKSHSERILRGISDS